MKRNLILAFILLAGTAVPVSIGAAVLRHFRHLIRKFTFNGRLSTTVWAASMVCLAGILQTLLIATASPIQAHELWVEQTTDGISVVNGYDGNGCSPCDPKKSMEGFASGTHSSLR
ncbi:MAG: hypothetical protein KKD73_11270 [Proteobacteria bacterium]|nr:hypothetical protein [Pseudomonadota bacterium]MBU1641551.1 hypothetical protein [Pseudomonadota bacterium]